jgi:hypothetical protein
MSIITALPTVSPEPTYALVKSSFAWTPPALVEAEM